MPLPPAVDVRAAVFADGCALLPRAVGEPTLREIEAAIAEVERGAGTLRRGGALFAVREALGQSPRLDALARSDALRGLVVPILGSDARPVRATWFDKPPGRDWGVAWHQDRTVFVAERRDVAGFGPWTTKAGMIAVEPPREILERMLAVRIHLDASGLDNGPLRVRLGLHDRGKLGDAELAALGAGDDGTVVCAARGDVLLMRPLLPHASSRSTRPAARRVLHVEFASGELPGGLLFAALR